MKVKPVSPVSVGGAPDGRSSILQSIESVDTEGAARPYHSQFRRPWWLFSGHLETLYSAKLCAKLDVEYDYQEAFTPDSDVVLFHYIRGQRNLPLVVVFHGLEGSSGSPSVKMIAHHFSRQGWSVVVPHFRTCGVMNRLPRAYHAGDADEVGWMVKYAVSLVNAPRAHAVGISLGGNALVKWLGTSRQTLLASAAAVCAPLDLSLCSKRLGGWLNRRIYADHFLETLVEKVRFKMSQYPFLLDRRSADKIRTIRQFDDVYTAPVHGYDGVRDYYERASARRDLPQVSTNLLCINPLNDPLVPAKSLPAQKEMPPCVLLEKPRHGGHLGFVSGRKRAGWLPERLEAFFTGK